MDTTETRSTSTERVRAHRKRTKRGMHRLSITLTDAQLDALEVSTPTDAATAPMSAMRSRCSSGIC